MEEIRLKENSGLRREDERKQSYSHRDIKRKLFLIKKKVDDLQQRRKIAYKNSVKVKRIVHNQVNQIDKCLRSRERYLWSEIDDAYLSQDESISQELLRLQTICSNCQTLFDHLEDSPQKTKALAKIYCNLSQVNFEENFNIRPLEFTSEFEILKNMATDFGNLTGDFAKKDEFVIIDKDISSNMTYLKINNNREHVKKTVPEKQIGNEDLNNEYLNIKTDLEDCFEVISFDDKEYCEDVHMVDQENFKNGCQQIENSSFFNKNGKKLRDSNKLENSLKGSKDIGFNPVEEWKQLYELKNRISSISAILPNLENECCSSRNVNATTNNLKAGKCRNEFVYLSPDEVNEWLPPKKARNDEVSNKCPQLSKYSVENRERVPKMNSELEKNKVARSYDLSQTKLIFLSSPADAVRKEFSKYTSKDGIENWLVRH